MRASVSLRQSRPARTWQQTMMRGLTPPNPDYVGRFRGEAGLEGVGVRIGNRLGTASQRIAAELQSEDTPQRAVEALDASIEPGRPLTGDQLAAVIDLCAWAHSEWVRIHPFANGNGRTARLLGQFHCYALRAGHLRASAPQTGWRIRKRCCRGHAGPMASDSAFIPTNVSPGRSAPLTASRRPDCRAHRWKSKCRSSTADIF